MAKLFSFFTSKRYTPSDFERLLGPHVDALYRSAYHLTQNQHSAEDLVQELLTHLCTRLHDVEAVEHPRTWLLRALYNKFVDLHRKGKRSVLDQALSIESPSAISNTSTSNTTASKSNKEGEGDDASSSLQIADPNDLIEQAHLSDQLQKALAQLDESQKIPILLHDVEGYTFEEVAEILNKSVGTIKSRIHRGRKKLKETLNLETF